MKNFVSSHILKRKRTRIKSQRNQGHGPGRPRRARPGQLELRKSYILPSVSSIHFCKTLVMQPPPQAVPSGVAAPPPARNPQSIFWTNSPYRRRANNNAPVAPITCPLQPVTDPFAFSRQALQNMPLGSSSKIPPILQGPASSGFPQRSGLPAPHTNARDSSQGPCEPLPRPLSQPRADASSFSGALTPSALPRAETNRSAEINPSAETEVQAPPYLQHYIPGVGPDMSHGTHLHGSMPGPDQPLSRQNLNDGAVAPAATPFSPQPRQQMPGQWGPVQASPQPSCQNHSPCLEGPVQIAVPHATSVPHPPSSSSPHQGLGPEPHNPVVSLSAPLASDGRSEVAHLQSGSYSANNFDLENTFRQNPRVGNTWTSQEFRQSPGVNKEHQPFPTFVSPFAQGDNPENHMHHPPGAAASLLLPDTDSGALSMFFQGAETENEENLSSENAGSGKSDFEGFSSSPGLGHAPLPAHGGGGICQDFLQGSNIENTQQGGETHLYFAQSAGIQHDEQTTKNTASDTWGDTANAGTQGAGASQYENIENLEFIQNQEVLPSKSLNFNPSSPSDQFRYGVLPGPALPRHSVVGHTGAPDTTLHPVRSDSVSSGYSSKSHRSLSGSTRPQELVGTFIQQEVGKPEDEVSGSFFKQIDSSPIGGETDETSMSQNHHSSLSQPSTPSPPKPTGIFQTSANSSFEPVKSHLVGIKPVEADRANVVGEVRGTRAYQKKCRPPDASPGNLEQPPDNMETLFAPQVCPLPLNTTAEAGRVLPHIGGPPLDTVHPTPERKPSARAHGAGKCESPATTLWAQNELPDFGGNVLLAPAAPVLQVPAKPQLPAIVRPPEEVVPGQQSQKPDSATPLQNRDGIGALENLENPPTVGEEEVLQSQASSGHAGVLPLLPTEPLQHQPVSMAQLDQSYNLAQPINFSMSLLNLNGKNQSWRDTLVGDKSPISSRVLSGDSGENASLSGIPTSSVLSLSLPSSLAQSNIAQGSGTSEMVSNQPANLLIQPPSHPLSKNLVLESQKNHNAENVPPEFNSSDGSMSMMLVPPANSTLIPESNKANCSSNWEEPYGALDFTLTRTLENPVRMCSPSCSDSLASQHNLAKHPGQSGPGPHNPDHFYQQVTKDAQDQPGLGSGLPGLLPPQQQNSSLQVPKTALAEPSSPESPPAQGQPQNSTHPPASLAPADVGQQLPPQLPQSSSASLMSTGSSQVAKQSEPQWPQLMPPQALGPLPQDMAAYYHYRPLHEAYQSQYPSLYPPDPGVASLYYQDIYGLYEPRYRPYDSATSVYAEYFRCPEPERPSSRASHCSDRPPPRQGYPEGYYNSKNGWSSQSDFYANYYSSQYDYRDPGRWDRFHYSTRFKDPRPCDRRYWYDVEYDPYRKEHYAYGDRPEKYDDHWRYDPRFTGSFDDDPEPHRDPYGEEVDRHSVHSEHSARSLPSRHSSLSSHSHQSQIYRSHNATASSYEAPPPPGSLHGDYVYGAYGGNFHSAQGFPEYGYPTDSSWSAVEQVPSRPTSPEKFSVPHICARFGPGGQLIKVIPNLPSEGQPALVEVHSMETLLQHTAEQEEMRAFPGPLGKGDTHKVDVINFAQNKATKCLQDENLIDRESASLLWNFIVLLCRQNGTVVGTDIAELLLRDHRTVWLPGKSPNEANLIDFTNEAVDQVEEEEAGEAQLSFLTDSQPAAASTLERETERFRELLLYGRKKDALESAMKNGLWGHALLLASKMDSRTHARVMTRFANSLPINDPLQTVYQLMSGRMPAASMCCGDEKWGDWRPHLAMVLSNLNNNVDVECRTMATMGDTLASKGLLDAAHFCYLMAQVGFGFYTKKSTKLVLIGSNHSLPFSKFATNEAIQRTEAYEYAQSLGAQTCPLPSFQVFKFIYLCRLAEVGLATQAFHYCEVIAKSILTQPHRYSAVLISQLIQVASQLRLFDPQLKEKPEEESFVEPTWLVHLQHMEKQIKEGAVVWSQDGAFAQQCPSTPSSEGGQLDGPGLGQPVDLEPDNLLLEVPVPSTEHLSQGVQLLPSAPQMLTNAQLANPARVPVFPVPPPPGPLESSPGYGPPGSAPGFPEPSRAFQSPPADPAALYPGPGLPPGTPSLQESRLLQEARSADPGMLPQEAPVRNSLPEPSEEDLGGNFANLGPSRTVPDAETPTGWDPANLGSTQPPLSVTPAPEMKRPGQAVKKEVKEPKKSESWFSRWLPGKKRTEAYLPDDKNKSIVWDEKKNQWVNLNEPEEEKKAPPPPPTSFPAVVQAAPSGPAGVNMFSRRAAGTRARYVDVLNPRGTQRNEPALAPADFFAPLAPLPIPPNFVPNPDAEETQLADGAGREGQTPARGQAPPEQVLSSAASHPGSELPPSQPDCPRGGAPGDLPAAGGPPGGTVPFYNPAQLAQASTTSGSSRPGRIGQRKYPMLN
ncbi:protein transport protein Sec16A isoform X3 [Nycticebus coucang]|uniref:protein transport protein Sec16A isoform X3 n=1 Tax=Nycticebus coucang TaxID=9470 RepID=UPI00234C03CC|nr:protein transport protein Sec16A isoform X3 [Nycticebus coucang]